MALSNIASHLLAYLKIYKLTPNVFADKLSGAYPADYSTEQWFLDNLNYNTQSFPQAPKGLFRTALKELLDAGY